MPITFIFENEQDKIDIPPTIEPILKSVAEETLSYLKFLPHREIEVGLTVVDDQEIKMLNLENRNKDAVTDVLSFPMLDFDEPVHPLEVSPVPEPVLLGDIVISAERAASQAITYGHSFQREMAFLTVHSMLHLLGYDHELGEEEELIMFSLQDEILNNLGIDRS